MNGHRRPPLDNVYLGRQTFTHRDTALNVAEAFIALQMVEILTFSGGIGISEEKF